MSVADDLSQVLADAHEADRSRTLAGAVGAHGAVLETILRGGGTGPTVRTLWDVASLTKVLVTVPIVLRLVSAESRLTIGDRVARFLPALAGCPVGDLQLGDLMSHLAGLPAEIPPSVTTWPAFDDFLRRTDAQPGRAVRYSDVGYALLGRVVEQVGGVSLDDAVTEHVRVPLGLHDLAMHSAPARDCVPAGPRVGTDQVVHDPAAGRLGPAGHAGLFCSLADLGRLAAAWLDEESGWLGRDGWRAFRCRTHDVDGGHRGLGWSLPGDPYHCASHDWSCDSVSHTGFTGSSILLDPGSGRWAVLLTDLQPVAGDASEIVRLRRRFHAAAAAYFRS